MIEKLLASRRRIEIKEYAKERWNIRKRDNDDMDARTAALVQEDVFRFIRKQNTRGVFSSILVAIAIKFAAKLINQWLEDWIDER